MPEAPRSNPPAALPIVPELSGELIRADKKAPDAGMLSPGDPEGDDASFLAESFLETRAFILT